MISQLPLSLKKIQMSKQGIIGIIGGLLGKQEKERSAGSKPSISLFLLKKKKKKKKT
jgi:hypothetical protein